MKTKDIKPGVVYGFRRGKYGVIEPVVFLAEPGPHHLYTEPRHRKDSEPVFVHVPRAGKPCAGRGFGESSVGYPAAVARIEDVDPAELLKVTLDDFLTATLRYDEGRRISFRLIVNPAYILGPYDEAIAEDERQSKARQRQYDEELAQRNAACDRASRLMGALASHGIASQSQPSYEPTALVIPLDDVEKLLERLDPDPEGTGSL